MSSSLSLKESTNKAQKQSMKITFRILNVFLEPTILQVSIDQPQIHFILFCKVIKLLYFWHLIFITLGLI